MAEKEQRAALSARAVIEQAYGFVKGSESVESFTAYTFEEALSQQLDRLTNGGEDGMSATAFVEQIRTNLLAVVDVVATLPEEEVDGSVNTDK